MITRYDMTVAFHGSEYFPEAVLSSDGEFVAYDEHEAAMQRSAEAHAANLAAVEARALRMEQTIARVQQVLRAMDESLKYVSDPTYQTAAASLRAALETT